MEIYLDNGSTTKAHKQVAKAMEEVLLREYGNPSSSHLFGIKAKEIVNVAKKQLAEEINAKSTEIVFTSGATEAINLALQGANVKKILISSIEHSAVYETTMHLRQRGVEIVIVPVDKHGMLDLDQLRKVIFGADLLSIIHVQNEFGTIQNLEEISQLCKENKVLLHVDAAQSFGKLMIDVRRLGIDLLSASGHKISGPKGIGFLYVREGIKLNPIIFGAGQEKGLRSGTENVPGIRGFSRALEIVKNVDKKKIEKNRDYFMKKLENMGGKINGDNRIYNNIHVSFSVDASNLVAYLSENGIFLSTKSACSNEKENRVLKAIGLSDKEIKGSFRIVLDESIDKKKIDFVIGKIKKGLEIYKF